MGTFKFVSLRIRLRVERVECGDDEFFPSRIRSAVEGNSSV